LRVEGAAHSANGFEISNLKFEIEIAGQAFDDLNLKFRFEISNLKFEISDLKSEIQGF